MTRRSKREIERLLADVEVTPGTPRGGSSIDLEASPLANEGLRHILRYRRELSAARGETVDLDRDVSKNRGRLIGRLPEIGA